MLIELYDIQDSKHTLLTKDTYENFVSYNEEDEEVLEALEELRSASIKEKIVATGQGYFLLRVSQ